MTKQLLPAASLLLLTFFAAGQKTTAPADDSPVYTASGDFIAPIHYREWIYLTSGIDMSYEVASSPPDHSSFNNIFVNPSAYRSFIATGTWPDKTILVLEVRGADNPVSINKHGHTQSAEIMDFEYHVKDHGKWTFYNQNGKHFPRQATCYSCHEAHAAVDTTFVQFYPTLLPLAKSKNTLSPAYLKELPAQAPVAPAPPT